MVPEKFKLDFYRMTGNKWTSKGYLKLLFYHNLRFSYWFRKNEEKHTLYRKYMLFRLARKFGLEVSTSAKIGEGLYLGHPYNITIGHGAILGKNVNLNKGCTIGRENRGKRKGIPTIGNNVYIGINATVVGNVNIGDDVMIAPNAFVNFDVPAHSIVVGNPGTVISKENATDEYVAFRV